MRATLAERVLRFASPLPTAHGTLHERPLIELSLTGSDGVTGRGEAAPLADYDGVTVAMVREALEAYLPVLAAGDGASGSELLEGCRATADLPQALAAVDLALWDSAGRRAGVPVCRLLVDDPLEAVPVNASIGALDRAGAARAAAEAVAQGFACLKVKVGAGDDAGRVAAVRAAAGSEALLRLDANGAWSVEEAMQALERLAPAGVELIEEPVHGVAQLAQLRARVPVRVAMDESSTEAGALASGAADAVCLKISSRGGISGLLAAAALVRTTGAEVYVASTYDGPLGIAAGLHAAAALGARSGSAGIAHCGLATLGLFTGVEDPFPARGGVIEVPRGSGLGV